MLTTLAKVKEFLKIPVAEDTDDSTLTRLLSSVDAFVKSYCHRDLEAATITEYHSTKFGQTVLALKEYPVNSITSIHDDPLRTYAAGDLIAATDYIVQEEGGIVRLDGVVFGTGLKNVKVIYNAGYATIPADLEQAVLELVAGKYHTYDKIKQGVESRSFAGETVQYFLGDMLPETKAVLLKYRRVEL